MDISARQAHGVVDFLEKKLRIFLFKVVIFSSICIKSIILSIHFPFSFFNINIRLKDFILFKMVAVINFARKWNKTAYYLFSGYYILRTENFRINHFLSGFLDFFVNISTLAKTRVEILTKKSRNPLRKWISLKFPVLPCNTLKRVNK